MTAKDNQDTPKEEDHSKVLDPSVVKAEDQGKEELTRWQKFKKGCKTSKNIVLYTAAGIGAGTIGYHALPDQYQEAVRDWLYDTIVAPFNGSGEEQAEESIYEKRMDNRISQLEKDSRTRINTLSEKLNAANEKIQQYETAEETRINAEKETIRKKQEAIKQAEEAKKKAEEAKKAKEAREAQEALERAEQERRERVLNELIKYRNDLASKNYALEQANKKIKTYEEQEKYRKAVEEKRSKRKSLINKVISKLMTSVPERSRIQKAGDLYRSETQELETNLEKAFDGSDEEFYKVLEDHIEETERREERLRLGLPMNPTEEEKQAEQEKAEKNEEKANEDITLGDVLDVLKPVQKPSEDNASEQTNEANDEQEEENEEDIVPVIIQ